MPLLVAFRLFLILITNIDIILLCSRSAYTLSSPSGLPAAGPPDLEAQDVWSLLQVVLPEVQGALWDTLHELRQAMLALAHTQDNHRTRVS